jgi:hypothetical protein
LVSGNTRRKSRNARSAGRQAANSHSLELLARAGLAARGVLYIIIGLIAIQVALSHSRKQADRSGALRAIASTPFGSVALWLLVVGFAGMALWRLSEALYGGPGPDGRKASSRLAALARAALYGFITYGILKYALGLGAPSSSDKQSKDLTATVMSHPGGKIVVILAGIAFIGGGAYIAYSAARKKFLKQLMLGQLSLRARRAVEKLGQVGGIARGTVFATAGIFLVVAAAEAKPGKAKGVDSSLRALAHTPLGPWLLVVVAAGLVTFGVYSLCEARWRRV